jgi:metallo-beta-lactamase family protein
VSSLDEMSGHGDQAELLEWLRPLSSQLRKIFLVHGEPAQSETLAELIRQRYNVETVIPARGQSFELD